MVIAEAIQQIKDNFLGKTWDFKKISNLIEALEIIRDNRPLEQEDRENLDGFIYLLQSLKRGEKLEEYTIENVNTHLVQITDWFEEKKEYLHSAEKIRSLILDEKLISHSTYHLYYSYQKKEISIAQIKNVLKGIFKYGIIAKGSPLRGNIDSAVYGINRGHGTDFQYQAYHEFIKPHLLYDSLLALNVKKNHLNKLLEYIVDNLLYSDWHKKYYSGFNKLGIERAFLSALSIQRNKVFWKDFVEIAVELLRFSIKSEKDVPEYLERIKGTGAFFNQILRKWISFISNTSAPHLKRWFIREKIITLYSDKIGFLIHKPDLNRTPFLTEECDMANSDYMVYDQIKPKEFAAIVLPEDIYPTVKDIIPKWLPVVTQDLRLLSK